MSEPIPQITLTAEESAAVTIALRLEQAGWIAAAHWLRLHYFPKLSWKEAPNPTTHAGWTQLFRAHHGSLPPLPAPQPQVITPTIRPDQTHA